MRTIQLTGVNENEVRTRIKMSLYELRRDSPRKWITWANICKMYRYLYPEDKDIPDWYIRHLIRMPHFELREGVGWAINPNAHMLRHLYAN